MAKAAARALLLSLAPAAVAGQNPPNQVGGCEDIPTLKFDNAVIEHSNLGGQGPDGGPQHILYHGLGNMPDGTPIGLKITAAGPGYQTTHPEKNGMNNGMGQINVQDRTQTHLTFQFVNANTNADMCVGKGGMTFYDVDGGNHVSNHQQFEIISVCPGADQTVLSNMYQPSVPTMLEEVTATTPNNPFPNLPKPGCKAYKPKAPIRNVADPTDLDNLNAGQLSHTITYRWDNMCTFDVDFANAFGNPKDGRNFWFTGVATQAQICPPVTPFACDDTCDICNAGDTCLQAIRCKISGVRSSLANGGGSADPDAVAVVLPDFAATCQLAQAEVNKRCPNCQACTDCPTPTAAARAFSIVAGEDDDATGEIATFRGRASLATALGAVLAVSGAAAAIVALRRRAARPPAAAPCETEELVEG